MTYTNLDYLNEFTGGDPDLVKEAIQRYLKKSPELLKDLNESYYNGNWEQVAFVAHSLYSSTQIVGIISISEPLKEIQKLAKENNNSDQIESHLLDINKAVEASYRELNGYK